MKTIIIVVILGLFSSGFAGIKSHKNFDLLPSKCGEDFSDNKILLPIVSLGQYSWSVLLEYSKNGTSTGHKCAGVLISDRYVLTATHCVGTPASVGKLFRVRLGEHDLRTNPDCEEYGGADHYCAEPHQDIEVEKIIEHPEYTIMKNDISLLRLAKPAVINDGVQPICLPLNGEESAASSQLIFGGWTRTGDRSQVKSEASVYFVDFETCSNKYTQHSIKLTNSQFCGRADEVSCDGLGGGPLINGRPERFYVQGILSFGPKQCAKDNIPLVYTKVSSYLNWILDNLKP